MPEKTLDATFARGVIGGDTISGHFKEAGAALGELENVGVSYDDVVALLEPEGLDNFVTSWKELLADVEAAFAMARKASA